MGCVGSKGGASGDAPNNTSVEKDKSKKIDKELEGDKQKLNKEVKLLLLGAGESGKSTIMKQMKLIYGSGYSKEECAAFSDIVYLNVVKSMQALISGAEKLGIPIAESEKENKELIMNLSGRGANLWSEKAAQAVKSLWKDSGIAQAYERSAEFQLIDSSKYYFDNIDRLMQADYIPTEQDVLRSRVATTGITETAFNVENYVFRVTDVGGQRSERKKWISCFQDVTALIFVVSLSEFDQVLFEDEETNRMAESLKLFGEICNNKYFEDTSIILFLNKTDIFKAKLDKQIDPKIAFPEYNGGCDYALATEHIKNKFVSLNKSARSGREIFARLTCATDTANMRFVLDAVKTIILQKRLESVGFL